MISLRKAMDHEREALLHSALECCKSVVAAMAENGARVCPPVADTFQQNLVALCQGLSAVRGPQDLSRTEQDIERELEGWGTRAREYYRQKAGEIRDVMLTMTEAAKAVTDRDERYRVQFAEVSARLQQTSGLEDLASVREAVHMSAVELRSCVDRMMEDGRQSVARLKSQLAAYERRLEDAERASATDTLTGLLNRGGMEREIAKRIAAESGFCLVVADLNGFKQINDAHGHAAGDALLKAFAQEFKGQFRPVDPVGRWGGDEFVVVLDCPLEEARSRIERVRKWTFGEYSVAGAGKVLIGAAIGIAEWTRGCSAESLFCAADRAMYAEKRAR